MMLPLLAALLGLAGCTTLVASQDLVFVLGPDDSANATISTVSSDGAAIFSDSVFYAYASVDGAESWRLFTTDISYDEEKETAPDVAAFQVTANDFEVTCDGDGNLLEVAVLINMASGDGIPECVDHAFLAACYSGRSLDASSGEYPGGHFPASDTAGE